LKFIDNRELQKVVELTSTLSSERTAPITRPRLLLMALAGPEPSSVLIVCTLASSRPWRVRSGDNDAGDICDRVSSIDNRTRADIEYIAGARPELRKRRVITDGHSFPLLADF
jgi:hypothetical protein